MESAHELMTSQSGQLHLQSEQLGCIPTSIKGEHFFVVPMRNANALVLFEAEPVLQGVLSPWVSRWVGNCAGALFLLLLITLPELYIAELISATLRPAPSVAPAA